jgi:addiction module HigA family antidote
MTHRRLRNIHPGKILLEEFLNPLGISQNALARAIGVPPRRINEIALGKRSISADTTVRLARALGTSEAFWMGPQADYDLEQARSELADQLPEIEQLAV